MNTRLINFIIGFSLVGITFVFISDYFNQTRLGQKQLVLAPTATVATATPTPKPDPLVNCQNDFFNFQKGTNWRYKLVWGEKKKAYFFTNKILESSASSVIIETKFDDSAGSITKIVCRQSGIWGFPYPLFPPLLTDKSKEQGNFFKSLKMNSNVFFLPPSPNIEKGSVWKSQFVVDPDIPLVENVVIEIENKITSGEKKLLFGKNRATSSVETYFKAINLPFDLVKPSKNSVMQYDLIEEIGIRNLKFDYSLPDFGSLKSEINLLNFIEPPISSSQ